jgi:pentatricopeptide repeat protein
VLVQHAGKKKDLPSMLKYFNEMAENDIVPDEVTFLSIIDYFAKMGDIKSTKQSYSISQL